MSDLRTVGLDLAKNTFFAVALSGTGKRQWRKKLSRTQVLRTFAQQQMCRIAMEACAGAHYWARKLQELGHEVVLLPAHHVKGYLRGQKNDYNDAEAIAEACLHGRVRPVRPKTLEQQEMQSMHRMRKLLVAERTALVNHVRGLLAEYGVVIAQGRARFGREMPFVLEDAENDLTPRMRELLARQLDRYRALDEELSWYDQQIKEQVRQDEVCRQLMTVPAFGPVVSSVFRGWIGDGRQFRCGREASAALGIVPRQYSTGGKPTLLGITKKGDKELRSLVIHGARAVVKHAHKKDDPLSRWIQRLMQRRGTNKAVVALANKLVRIAWAIVTRGEVYRVQPA